MCPPPLLSPPSTSHLLPPKLHLRAHARMLDSADNLLLLSLDKGFSGRVQPGGVERVDVLGAAGRGGAVDKDQEIHDDRTYRSVSRVFSLCLPSQPLVARAGRQHLPPPRRRRRRAVFASGVHLF